MTIPHDKPTPTQPTPSDAVVSLIARLLYGDSEEFPYERMPETVHRNHEAAAQRFLSALSDAGLAVLPLEATDEMRRDVYPALGGWTSPQVWRRMAAAFHPSQLEKTDE